MFLTCHSKNPIGDKKIICVKHFRAKISWRWQLDMWIWQPEICSKLNIFTSMLDKLDSALKAPQKCKSKAQKEILKIDHRRKIFLFISLLFQHRIVSWILETAKVVEIYSLLAIFLSTVIYGFRTFSRGYSRKKIEEKRKIVVNAITETTNGSVHLLCM